LRDRGFIGGNRPSAGASPAPKAADANATTGIAAVQQSKLAREQQEVSRIGTDSPSSMMRTAGGKTFYLREGVWIDSDFKTGMTLPETVVKFGSDEYFALLKQKPRLAEFFSLGEQVIVIFQGRTYRVSAAN
jgi:hypothetical protein